MQTAILKKENDMSRIRMQLPPRKIVVCNLDEHNAVQAFLKEKDVLGEKWQVLIVAPDEVERAITSFQEIADDRRITDIFISEHVDRQLYPQLRDFCTINGAVFFIVDVEKGTVE